MKGIVETVAGVNRTPVDILDREKTVETGTGNAFSGL